MESARLLDLIRVGVYTQMEGSLTRYQGYYRFRFQTNQIEDMHELVYRVVGATTPKEKRLTISLNSEKLYLELVKLGFTEFSVVGWNVPKQLLTSPHASNEYLRAVIDSLGNVDIENNVPVVRLTSVNITSMSEIGRLFSGRTTFDPSETRYRVYWKGQNALNLLNQLDWKFYNRRNDRGTQLIRQIRWEDYLI